MLWSFWALKEAAYKVFMKQTSDASFVPRRWSVCVSDSLETRTASEGEVSGLICGTVRIPGAGELYFALRYAEACVHALAADSTDLLKRAVWHVRQLPANPEIDASVFGRSCLIHDLSAHWQVEKHRLEIRREHAAGGEIHPPVVYLDGAVADVEVSLSHDGRFVAFAYLI